MSNTQYLGLMANGKFVIKCVGRRKNQEKLYKYRCNCGRIAVTNFYGLNKSKFCYDCRIIRKPMLTLKGEAGLHRLYGNYKYIAKKRNLIFNLTIDEFSELTNKTCYYCKAKPKNKMKSQTLTLKNGTYTYNGVDRVNNNKGYTKDNTVACCTSCNKAKLSLTSKQFKSLIRKIYHNWAKY